MITPLGPPLPAWIVAEQLMWIRRNDTTTPLKLLKLVYIAHGWHLGLAGISLVNEAVEAWKHGPVIPEIYHRYKWFGGDPIAYRSDDLSKWLEKDLSQFLEAINQRYGQLSVSRLYHITHKQGSPWQQTVDRYGLDTVIPTEIIRKHYQALSSG